MDQLITCQNIEEVMLNSRKDKRRTLIIIEPSHYPLSLIMLLFCLTQMEKINKSGWIVSQMAMPRFYIFQTDTGQFWRNWCHLNQVLTSSQITTHNPQPESNQIITQTRTGTAIQPPERLSDSYRKGRCGITPNVTMTLMFVYLVLIYQTLIKC